MMLTMMLADIDDDNDDDATCFNNWQVESLQSRRILFHRIRSQGLTSDDEDNEDDDDGDNGGDEKDEDGNNDDNDGDPRMIPK